MICNRRLLLFFTLSLILFGVNIGIEANLFAAASLTPGEYVHGNLIAPVEADIFLLIDPNVSEKYNKELETIVTELGRYTNEKSPVVSLQLSVNTTLEGSVPFQPLKTSISDKKTADIPINSIEEIKRYFQNHKKAVPLISKNKNFFREHSEKAFFFITDSSVYIKEQQRFFQKLPQHSPVNFYFLHILSHQDDAPTHKNIINQKKSVVKTVDMLCKNVKNCKFYFINEWKQFAKILNTFLFEPLGLKNKKCSDWSDWSNCSLLNAEDIKIRMRQVVPTTPHLVSSIFDEFNTFSQIHLCETDELFQVENCFSHREKDMDIKTTQNVTERDYISIQASDLQIVGADNTLYEQEVEEEHEAGKTYGQGAESDKVQHNIDVFDTINFSNSLGNATVLSELRKFNETGSDENEIYNVALSYKMDNNDTQQQEHDNLKSSRNRDITNVKGDMDKYIESGIYQNAKNSEIKTQVTKQENTREASKKNLKTINETSNDLFRKDWMNSSFLQVAVRHGKQKSGSQNEAKGYTFISRNRLSKMPKDLQSLAYYKSLLIFFTKFEDFHQRGSSLFKYCNEQLTMMTRNLKELRNLIDDGNDALDSIAVQERAQKKLRVKKVNAETRKKLENEIHNIEQKISSVEERIRAAKVTYKDYVLTIKIQFDKLFPDVYEHARSVYTRHVWKLRSYEKDLMSVHDKISSKLSSKLSQLYFAAKNAINKYKQELSPFGENVDDLYEDMSHAYKKNGEIAYNIISILKEINIRDKEVMKPLPGPKTLMNMIFLTLNLIDKVENIQLKAPTINDRPNKAEGEFKAFIKDLEKKLIDISKKMSKKLKDGVENFKDLLESAKHYESAVTKIKTEALGIQNRLPTIPNTKKTSEKKQEIVKLIAVIVTSESQMKSIIYDTLQQQQSVDEFMKTSIKAPNENKQPGSYELSDFNTFIDNVQSRLNKLESLTKLYSEETRKMSDLNTKCSNAINDINRLMKELNDLMSKQKEANKKIHDKLHKTADKIKGTIKQLKTKHNTNHLKLGNILNRIKLTDSLPHIPPEKQSQKESMTNEATTLKNYDNYAKVLNSLNAMSKSMESIMKTIADERYKYDTEKSIEMETELNTINSSLSQEGSKIESDVKTVKNLENKVNAFNEMLIKDYLSTLLKDLNTKQDAIKTVQNRMGDLLQKYKTGEEKITGTISELDQLIQNILKIVDEKAVKTNINSAEEVLKAFSFEKTDSEKINALLNAAIGLRNEADSDKVEISKMYSDVDIHMKSMKDNINQYEKLKSIVTIFENLQNMIDNVNGFISTHKSENIRSEMDQIKANVDDKKKKIKKDTEQAENKNMFIQTFVGLVAALRGVAKNKDMVNTVLADLEELKNLISKEKETLEKEVKDTSTTLANSANDTLTKIKADELNVEKFKKQMNEHDKANNEFINKDMQILTDTISYYKVTDNSVDTSAIKKNMSESSKDKNNIEVLGSNMHNLKLEVEKLKTKIRDLLKKHTGIKDAHLHEKITKLNDQIYDKIKNALKRVTEIKKRYENFTIDGLNENKKMDPEKKKKLQELFGQMDVLRGQVNKEELTLNNIKTEKLELIKAGNVAMPGDHPSKVNNGVGESFVPNATDGSASQPDTKGNILETTLKSLEALEGKVDASITALETLDTETKNKRLEYEKKMAETIMAMTNNLKKNAKSTLDKSNQTEQKLEELKRTNPTIASDLEKYQLNKHKKDVLDEHEKLKNKVEKISNLNDKVTKSSDPVEVERIRKDMEQKMNEVIEALNALNAEGIQLETMANLAVNSNAKSILEEIKKEIEAIKKEVNKENQLVSDSNEILNKSKEAYDNAKRVKNEIIQNLTDQVLDGKINSISSSKNIILQNIRNAQVSILKSSNIKKKGNTLVVNVENAKKILLILKKNIEESKSGDNNPSNQQEPPTGKQNEKSPSKENFEQMDKLVKDAKELYNGITESDTTIHKNNKIINHYEHLINELIHDVTMKTEEIKANRNKKKADDILQQLVKEQTETNELQKLLTSKIEKLLDKAKKINTSSNKDFETNEKVKDALLKLEQVKEKAASTDETLKNVKQNLNSFETEAQKQTGVINAEMRKLKNLVKETNKEPDSSKTGGDAISEQGSDLDLKINKTKEEQISKRNEEAQLAKEMVDKIKESLSKIEVQQLKFEKEKAKMSIMMKKITDLETQLQEVNKNYEIGYVEKIKTEAETLSKNFENTKSSLKFQIDKAVNVLKSAGAKITKNTDKLTDTYNKIDEMEKALKQENDKLKEAMESISKADSVEIVNDLKAKAEKALSTLKILEKQMSDLQRDKMGTLEKELTEAINKALNQLRAEKDVAAKEDKATKNALIDIKTKTEDLKTVDDPKIAENNKQEAKKKLDEIIGGKKKITEVVNTANGLKNFIKEAINVLKNAKLSETSGNTANSTVQGGSTSPEKKGGDDPDKKGGDDSDPEKKGGDDPDKKGGDDADQKKKERGDSDQTKNGKGDSDPEKAVDNLMKELDDSHNNIVKAEEEAQKIFKETHKLVSQIEKIEELKQRVNDATRDLNEATKNAKHIDEVCDEIEKIDFKEVMTEKEKNDNVEAGNSKEKEATNTIVKKILEAAGNHKKTAVDLKDKNKSTTDQLNEIKAVIDRIKKEIDKKTYITDEVGLKKAQEELKKWTDTLKDKNKKIEENTGKANEAANMIKTEKIRMSQIYADNARNSIITKIEEIDKIKRDAEEIKKMLNNFSINVDTNVNNINKVHDVLENEKPLPTDSSGKPSTSAKYPSTVDIPANKNIPTDNPPTNSDKKKIALSNDEQHFLTEISDTVAKITKSSEESKDLQKQTNANMKIIDESKDVQELKEQIPKLKQRLTELKNVAEKTNTFVTTLHSLRFKQLSRDVKKYEDLKNAYATIVNKLAKGIEEKIKEMGDIEIKMGQSKAILKYVSSQDTEEDVKLAETEMSKIERLQKKFEKLKKNFEQDKKNKKYCVQQIKQLLADVQIRDVEIEKIVPFMYASLTDAEKKKIERETTENKKKLDNIVEEVIVDLKKMQSKLYDSIYACNFKQNELDDNMKKDIKYAIYILETEKMSQGQKDKERTMMDELIKIRDIENSYDTDNKSTYEKLIKRYPGFLKYHEIDMEQTGKETGAKIIQEATQEKTATTIPTSEKTTLDEKTTATEAENEKTISQTKEQIEKDIPIIKKLKEKLETLLVSSNTPLTNMENIFKTLVQNYNKQPYIEAKNHLYEGKKIKELMQNKGKELDDLLIALGEEKLRKGKLDAKKTSSNSFHMISKIKKIELETEEIENMLRHQIELVGIRVNDFNKLHNTILAKAYAPEDKRGDDTRSAKNEEKESDVKKVDNSLRDSSGSPENKTFLNVDDLQFPNEVAQLVFEIKKDTNKASELHTKIEEDKIIIDTAIDGHEVEQKLNEIKKNEKYIENIMHKMKASMDKMHELMFQQLTRDINKYRDLKEAHEKLAYTQIEKIKNKILVLEMANNVIHKIEPEVDDFSTKNTEKPNENAEKETLNIMSLTEKLEKIQKKCEQEKYNINEHIKSIKQTIKNVENTDAIIKGIKPSVEETQSNTEKEKIKKETEEKKKKLTQTINSILDLKQTEKKLNDILNLYDSKYIEVHVNLEKKKKAVINESNLKNLLTNKLNDIKTMEKKYNDANKVLEEELKKTYPGFLKDDTEDNSMKKKKVDGQKKTEAETDSSNKDKYNIKNPDNFPTSSGEEKTMFQNKEQIEKCISDVQNLEKELKKTIELIEPIVKEMEGTLKTMKPEDNPQMYAGALKHIDEGREILNRLRKKQKNMQELLKVLEDKKNAENAQGKKYNSIRTESNRTQKSKKKSDVHTVPFRVATGIVACFVLTGAVISGVYFKQAANVD